MAATITSVRYQIRDLTEPYTFPDEIIQEALDAAADFIYRRYQGQGQAISNVYTAGNDPACMMPVTTGGFTYSNSHWVDYWLSANYEIHISTPTGAKIQRLMASVDLLTSLVMPTPDRTPTGVSEGGLSIQWGGDYGAAIQILNEQIDKMLFQLEAPMFCMYDNY